jgi:UDP-glucose 4-epimerase
MLIHQCPEGEKPARVVILGTNGFLARNLAKRLKAKGILARTVGSKVIDLTLEGAGDRLAQALNAEDSLVVMSAITPDKGRDIKTFMANMVMGENISKALELQPVSHIVYISSDAVYPFTDAAITENIPAAPTDLYSAMHRSREIMLAAAAKNAPYAILRPTMVLGAGDSHNSYGPNRFRRQAAEKGSIVLNGEGEELRDYIYIDDALTLIELVLHHYSLGILNLATGHSITFADLSRMVAACFNPPPRIEMAERYLPIMHRHFDAGAIHAAFPAFQFTPLKDALAKSHAAETGPILC